MALPIITIDMETYYDAQYSLTKLQTDAYITDPRYETILVSARIDDGPPQWFSGTEEETQVWLLQFDWANSACLCHHTLFDGYILSYRYGIKPKLWMDTKSMAVMLHPYLASYSLANLCKQFGLQDKGNEVHNMLGRSRNSLTQQELQRYAEYCVLDGALTKQLCDQFSPYVPTLELYLIDMTVRMFVEPKLEGDVHLLDQLYQDELARKATAMQLAGVDKDTIMSNDKFAAALIVLGVDPPRKISLKTGKEAWAFAKTDEAFTALQEHDDPAVQALVAARLGVKTTIAETRALRMLETARRGPLPVYLNYWGAKITGRYSGGNQCNWQNLPARGPSAGIRRAIHAPAGHTLVVGDSSNIELRVAMVAAGQDDVVQKLADGHDLYCDFASKMFGRIITKEDERERQLGKIAMLSLQYGAGWAKFQEMVRIQTGIKLSDDEAKNIVGLYRRVHSRVVDMWLHFESVVLPQIAAGNPDLIAVDKHGWVLATGLGFGVGGGPGVQYLNLRKEAGTDRFGRPSQQWVYDMGRKTTKIYGGKCVDGDALVLTELGWKPLKSIGSERVHDGVDFVEHGGIVFSGVKDCIAVDGVLMTPEHKVLTDEGWKTALEKPRPYRPDIRYAEGPAPDGQRRQEDAVGVSLPVLERSGEGRFGRNQGGEARRDPQLRVLHGAADVGLPHSARHEPPPGVRSVSVNAGSLSAAYASGLEKLRRTWHRGVLSVAGIFREFLGGHGGNIRAAAYAGAQGQLERVLARELCVGDVHGAGKQQTQQRPAGETPQKKAVYDIVNAGSRHRFVVLGRDGPFIVHNCFENYCQHVARQIVMWQTARIDRKFPVALSVHDEAVCVPENHLVTECVAYTKESLSLAPLWCRGTIPLACKVGTGMTYAEAK